MKRPFFVRAIADGRLEAGCELRRRLRPGSIVSVDLEMVERCTWSRRVMLLLVAVTRVCVAGEVDGTALSFGIGHDWVGAHEDVVSVLDGGTDRSMSGMVNMSAFGERMVTYRQFE